MLTPVSPKLFMCPTFICMYKHSHEKKNMQNAILWENIMQNVNRDILNQNLACFCLFSVSSNATRVFSSIPFTIR